MIAEAVRENQENAQEKEYDDCADSASSVDQEVASCSRSPTGL